MKKITCLVIKFEYLAHQNKYYGYILIKNVNRQGRMVGQVNEKW